MKFSYTFETRLEDTNNKYKITNKALLTLMENTAERHASSLNCGLKDINKTGITWVIVDWKLHVIKRAKYSDTLKIYTWVRNIDNYFSYRDFEVELNDEIIAYATSKWVLLDIKTKEIKMVSDNYKNDIDLDDKVFNEELSRLNILDKYDKTATINIRKSDIDLNGHVHNLNYIDFIKETFNDDIEFNNIRVIYKKEIKYNEIVNVKSKLNDEGIYSFLITDDKDNVFSIIECNN